MQDNTWLRTNTEKLLTEEINFLYDEGIFLFCSDKYEESIKWFDKIIAINPASKIALSYKGLALEKLKRPREAVKCYEKALVCKNECPANPKDQLMHIGDMPSQ